MKALAISAVAGLVCCAASAQAAPVVGVSGLTKSPASQLERVHYYYHHHHHRYWWWRHHHHHYRHYY